MTHVNKKKNSEDFDACIICDAPMMEVPFLGAYQDGGRIPKQFPLCIKCVRAASRRRLIEQIAETKRLMFPTSRGRTQ